MTRGGELVTPERPPARGGEFNIPERPMTRGGEHVSATPMSLDEFRHMDQMELSSSSSSAPGSPGCSIGRGFGFGEGAEGAALDDLPDQV